MNIPILINPDCNHLARVEETVDIINHLQKYFRLSILKANWLPYYEQRKKHVSSERIRQLVEKKFRDRPAIVVIENQFEDIYFSHVYRGLSIITLADWESELAPPPLKIYLAYILAEALIIFAADLPKTMIDAGYHEPPIGCFFDFCDDRQSIKLGMVGANLCGDCEVKLAGMGLSDQARESFEQILMFVRDATIRRPRAAPDHIFIGHGRSPTWLELRTFLTKDFGLKVEEFNQEAVAGLATTERLEEMLNRSCFAFIIMTAEDGHADKKMHARENVVHEIGLFQGRLGFQRAIILKEEGCADFSNIHGLTYIGFPKGNVSKIKKEIRRTLEREGVIEPIAEQKTFETIEFKRKRRISPTKVKTN